MSIVFDAPNAVTTTIQAQVDAVRARITGFEVVNPPPQVGELSITVNWILFDADDNPVGRGSRSASGAPARNFLQSVADGRLGVELDRLIRDTLVSLGDIPSGQVEED